MEGKAPNSPAIRTKGESATDGPTGNGNRGSGGGSLKKKRSSRRRSSMSDGAESLSRSGSDSSVSQHRKDSKNSDDGGGGGGGAGGQHGQAYFRIFLLKFTAADPSEILNGLFRWFLY